MDDLKRYLSGGHTRTEIRWHLAILVVGFWGLVLCARLGYPAANHYSINREMLSNLGSFDPGHNPQWYWLFSVAMVFCGSFMAPVMLYVRRRFAPVSPWASAVGAFFFLLGCLAIILTGMFPYAHHKILGWSLAHIHANTAGLIGFSFAVGIIWHGVLLLKDSLTEKNLIQQGATSYLPLSGPFFVCLLVAFPIVDRVHWDSLRAAIRAAASASGDQAVSDLTAAFSSMAHFPILEHLAIWALTIFVVWFAAVLPCQQDDVAQ